jgi:hypothetical protein
LDRRLKPDGNEYSSIAFNGKLSKGFRPLGEWWLHWFAVIQHLTFKTYKPAQLVKPIWILVFGPGVETPGNSETCGNSETRRQ